MTEWLDIANANLGLKEAPGKANNPKVVAFYAGAGHPEVKDDAVAWCAAFVGACLKAAGYPNTGSLAARSYLKYGQSIDKPRKGCIVVLKRGNSTWEGHVGFFIKQSATHVYLLGGNQGDAVSIAPFPKSKVLGYRWPVAATIPALKEAGSTEAAKIDLAEKVTVTTGAVTAAAKVADETGALDPSLKDVAENVDALSSQLEGSKAVAKFAVAHVALSTIVLLVVAFFVIRWWRKNRLARHDAGQPISTQV